MTAAFWTARPGGVLLTVRLTPNAGADRIEGLRLLADGKATLSVKVRAVPEDGKANEALCRLLAKALGLARSRIDIVAGQTGRVKTVEIGGDPVALGTVLAEW